MWSDTPSTAERSPKCFLRRFALIRYMSIVTLSRRRYSLRLTQHDLLEQYVRRHTDLQLSLAVGYLQLDGIHCAAAPFHSLNIAWRELCLIGDLNNFRSEGFTRERVHSHLGLLPKRDLSISVLWDVDSDRDVVQIRQCKGHGAGLNKLSGLHVARQHFSIHRGI